MTSTINTKQAYRTQDSIKDVRSNQSMNCILDKTYTFIAQCITYRFAAKGKLLFLELCDGSTAVSYTHLTLPTILLV